MQKQLLIYFLFLCGVPLLNAWLPPKGRRVFLLAVSIVFYCLISGKYAAVLGIATLISWGAALLMRRKPQSAGVLLAGSLILIFGALCAFKYLGFAAITISRVAALWGGGSVSFRTIAAPIGISFFTFAAAGYLIDVYRKKKEPEENLLTLALFLAFFPTVLSGPIERSDTLLPQLRKPEAADAEGVRYGISRILFGLAKKFLLADQLAVIVNSAYSDYGETSGIVMCIAACCYSIQIYCDFSAYSDMACGGGALLGFKLTENFRQPYFARSVKDFWHRWHLSLSGWLRDYLYIPLGGNRKGKFHTYINVLIVFAVSGLWHGAAWHFVVWGLVNGLFQVFGSITESARKRLSAALHIKEDGRFLSIWQHFITLVVIVPSMAFFRAESVTQAVLIIKKMLTLEGGLYMPSLAEIGKDGPGLIALGLSVILLFIYDLRERKETPAASLAKRPGLCCPVWCAIIFAILIFGAWGGGFSPMEFVYFNF